MWCDGVRFLAFLSQVPCSRYEILLLLVDTNVGLVYRWLLWYLYTISINGVQEPTRLVSKYIVIPLKTLILGAQDERIFVHLTCHLGHYHFSINSQYHPSTMKVLAWCIDPNGIKYKIILKDLNQQKQSLHCIHHIIYHCIYPTGIIKQCYQYNTGWNRLFVSSSPKCLRWYFCPWLLFWPFLLLLLLHFHLDVAIKITNDLQKVDYEIACMDVLYTSWSAHILRDILTVWSPSRSYEACYFPPICSICNFNESYQDCHQNNDFCDNDEFWCVTCYLLPNSSEEDQMYFFLSFQAYGFDPLMVPHNFSSLVVFKKP